MLAGGVSAIRPELVNGQGVTEVVMHRPLWWQSLPGLVMFFAAWLLGGGFAAILLLATAGDQPWFFAGWLLIWGGVGLLFLYGMIWRTFGLESLIAHSDRLTIMRRLLVLKNAHQLPAAAITAIEWIADDPTYRVTRNGRRLPQPAIQIEMGERQMSCARGIGEAEARSAIAALKQRLVIDWRRH